MQSGNQAFINQLKDIVGGPQLLTGDRNTERYRKGFRSGEGRRWRWRFPPACCSCGAFCRPAWPPTNRHHAGRQYRPDRRIDPSGNDYDRDIVIVSTLRLDHIQVLDNGKQVVGFPAAPCTTSRNCSSPTAANRIR